MVSERDGFPNRYDQLLVTGVVVDGKENRVDALGRSQRRDDAQVIGESLCLICFSNVQVLFFVRESVNCVDTQFTLKDLSGGNGENGSLGEPIGLIGPSVDGNAILDGFRSLVTNARRVYHTQGQLANAYGFQQIGRICLNVIKLLAVIIRKLAR